MRVKQINPPTTYVVTIQLKSKTWDQYGEDQVLGAISDFIDELNGSEFDIPYRGSEWLANNIEYDWAYAFDTIGERRKFVKALKRSLNSDIGLVTTLDLNN